MNTIITIGRQFGSGGHEIGRLLAQKLGIPCYDKELVKKIVILGVSVLLIISLCVVMMYLL